MLRDKLFFKPAGDTLLLLVLAQRVEFGVVAGADGRQWRAGTVGSHPIDSGAGMTALQALALALHTLPGVEQVARIRVLVADSWLAAAGVPWNSAMQRPGQAPAHARARLAQAGFALTPGDVIRLDSAAFGAPRLALGYPAELMGILALAASRHQAQLASVLPLSAAGWALARLRKQPAAVVLADTGTLIVARTLDGNARIQDITVRAGAAAHIDTVWQRLCLRDPPLAALQEVPLLDLSPGATALPARPFMALAAATRGDDAASAGLRLAASSMGIVSALDAVGAAPAWTRARAGVLAVAAAVACGAAWQAVSATRATHAVQAALGSAARPAAAAPRALAWTGAEVPRVVAVNVAIRELNLPFAAILRALAPAPDLKVAVLSVTTTPASAASQASTVKIIAEARTRADMARYVSFVAERKPFTGAYLTEHELDEIVPERPYRFTLEATWSDR